MSDNLSCSPQHPASAHVAPPEWDTAVAEAAPGRAGEATLRVRSGMLLRRMQTESAPDWPGATQRVALAHGFSFDICK